jgi:hypothetical protein
VYLDIIINKSLGQTEQGQSERGQKLFRKAGGKQKKKKETKTKKKKKRKKERKKERKEGWGVEKAYLWV